MFLATIGQFFDSLTGFVAVLFILVLAAILVYEYESHRREKG